MRCLTLDECHRWRAAHSTRRAWKRQVTFATPLDRLSWFTTALVDHIVPFRQALLVVDQVVFNVPWALTDLRRAAGEDRPLDDAPGHLFDGGEPADFRSALEAALSSWVDLHALFWPSRHALWADHDEYCTFLSESAGRVADVRRAVVAGHVREVVGFEAEIR